MIMRKKEKPEKVPRNKRVVPPRSPKQEV